MVITSQHILKLFLLKIFILGHFCYKPMMKVTCCPQYTIRCNAKDFQMNPSHKKVMKKVRNFLSREQNLLIKSSSNFDPHPINNDNKSEPQTPTELKDTMLTSYRLYVKYQIQVHNDKEEECSLEQFKRFLVNSPLQVLVH